MSISSYLELCFTFSRASSYWIIICNFTVLRVFPSGTVADKDNHNYYYYYYTRMNNNHTDMLSSMILTRTFLAWTSFLWPWGGRPSSGGRAERCCCWRGGEREISCCRGAGRGRRGSDGRRAAEATAVHLTSRVNTGCSCSPSLRSQSSGRLVWRWWCLFSCLRGKKTIYYSGDPSLPFIT